MKVKIAMNCLLVTTLLLSRAAFAAPHIESNGAAQQEASIHIGDAEAEALTAHLQTGLNHDVYAEVVQRIKADARQALSRQLQDTELFIHVVPATTNDFEITISDQERKIRLTSR